MLPGDASDQEREFVAEVVKELADAALMPERLHHAIFPAAKELRDRGAQAHDYQPLPTLF